MHPSGERRATPVSKTELKTTDAYTGEISAGVLLFPEGHAAVFDKVAPESSITTEWVAGRKYRGVKMSRRDIPGELPEECIVLKRILSAEANTTTELGNSDQFSAAELSEIRESSSGMFAPKPRKRHAVCCRTMAR